LTDAAPDEPRIRRILVALDASPQSVEVLRGAALLATGFEAELCGIFVEDSELFDLPGLPFVREVRVVSARVELLNAEQLAREVRALARRARRLLEEQALEAGLRWSFRTVRGRVVHELLSAAQDVDLVTLGGAGFRRLAGRRFGSTARELSRRLSRPLLLMHRGDAMHVPVCIVHGATASASRALETARRVAAALNGALHVFPAPEAGATPRSARSLAAAVGARGAGLLVMAADEPLLEGDGLQALFDELRCALLLVR
jgi:nucleotide-binding universal stress UspA family protein